MQKLDLLEKYYNMATHNLLCYSESYLMTKPKKGYDESWKRAKEECDLLDTMIGEENTKKLIEDINKLEVNENTIEKIKSMIETDYALNQNTKYTEEVWELCKGNKPVIQIVIQKYFNKIKAYST